MWCAEWGVLTHKETRSFLCNRRIRLSSRVSRNIDYENGSQLLQDVDDVEAGPSPFPCG